MISDASLRGHLHRNARVARVIPDGFADIGRAARRDGWRKALDEPMAEWLDSNAMSWRQAMAVAEAAEQLGLVTFNDLCRPETDTHIEREHGRRILRGAALVLQKWFGDHNEWTRGDDALEEGRGQVDEVEDELPGPMDLFSAPALRLGSAKQTALSGPPSSLPALRDWAARHGVLERLGDPAPVLPGGQAAWQTTEAPATVEEALIAGPPSRRRSATEQWTTRIRREAAAAYLIRIAENLAYLRSRRPSEAPPPIDPCFAGLAQAIEVTRTALLAAAPQAARPEGTFLPAPLLFVDEPPRLIYDEGVTPRDQVLVGYRQPSLVEVELASWRTRRLVIACHCSQARFGCAHGLAALDAAADLLRSPSSPAYRPLRELVSVPGWTRFLDRLDRALAQLPSREARAEERLIWRVSGGQGGMALLEAQRQTRGARGAWSRGTRISPSTLDRKPTLLAIASDARATEILTEGVQAGMVLSPSVVPGRTWRALEALIGAPNVFLADRRDVPLSIQVVAPRPRFCRSDTSGDDAGAVVLRVAIGERLIDPAQLLAHAPDHRHYIDADPATNRCHLARIEPELAALAGAFAAEPAPFPDEALPEVLRRMERIERVAGVDLPPELRGTTVLPDERLICRLTPLDGDGLRLEMRVRPLPGADDFPPGEGPRVLVTRREGGRISAERDLERERQAALRLAADIGLADAAPSGSWVFDLLDGARAFDAFLALRERAGDPIIEWPAEAWRVDQVKRSAVRLQVTERRDWFGLEGGVEIDGQVVPLQALLEAIRRGRSYVVLGPRRFALIEEELRRRLADAQDVLHQSRGAIELGGPAVEAVAQLVEDPSSLQTIPSYRTLYEGLRRAARREPVLPDGLTATLRHYQLDGFRWLSRLAAGGAGALLADDMGLGKTIQVLTVLLERAELGPALVIAPTSVAPNWMAEAARFVPSLRRILHRGAGRSTALAELGPGDLVVTSYALAVRDAAALAEVPFASLVLDEAQALKNAATRRSRAIRELKADWRVALTGTPIENHLGELWSLFRVVAPALFGSWDQFRERFALPIERHSDGERRQALGRLLRPFLLRRTKGEVAPELPAKTEVQRMVELSPGERRLYEQTRLAALAELGRGTPAQEGQARIQILAALTRLRQLACHPRLGDAASTLPSSKLRALVDILAEVRESGHRALIFSQFTRFLALCRQELESEGFKLLELDGSTPSATREARVAAFQRGEADAFLISLRAGGTGLNLTAADYVIHLDPWWNPAVEDQATDRAHRLGQRNAVTVVRLVARGTVEEAVLALHEEKRGLAASILDGAEAAAPLGAEELLALLRAHPDGDTAEESAADAEEVAQPGDPGDPAESVPADVEPPPPLPVDLALLDSLIALTLAPFRPSREGVSGTYRAYERSLAGFRSFVAEGRPATGAPLEECIEAYLRALADGAWPAPRSALAVARSTLKHLRRVAAAPGPAP
jgi:superfamily II DNA or RNA helicase